MGLPKISDFQFPISDSRESDSAIGKWKSTIGIKNQQSKITIKNQQTQIPHG